MPSAKHYNPSPREKVRCVTSPSRPLFVDILAVEVELFAGSGSLRAFLVSLSFFTNMNSEL